MIIIFEAVNVDSRQKEEESVQDANSWTEDEDPA